MGFSDWIHVLWVAGLVLQPLLVAVLVLKKEWQKFRFFAAYVMCSLLGDAIGFGVFRLRYVYLYVYLHPKVYLCGYLLCEMITVVLALGVIYEIFKQLFSSHLALRNLAWLAFRGVCVLLVVLGAAVIYAHGPINAKGIFSGVMVVEEASRIVEVGLIMFLFLFSTAFGLHWRQHMFGIVLGLGVTAAVKLAAVTIGSPSYEATGIVNVATMLFFDFSVLIWIGYLLTPERVAVSAEMPKRIQLEQWNQAVMELIHQ